MQNEKISEGLELIGSGFLALAEAFGKKVSSKVELDAAATAAMETTTNGSGKKEKKEKKAPTETKAEAKTETDQITEAQLRSALVEFAQTNGKEGAYAVLGKYGAKKVNELKKEDFPRVLAELEM